MGSSYHRLYYHMVWATYKRNPWIDDVIEPVLEKLIRDKLIVHRSKLLAFGCTADHLHLAVQLHSSLSVAGIIGEIKGYTSFTIANKIQPEMGFRWQGGYGAWSVNQTDLPRLISYIKNQKERHGQKINHHSLEIPQK